MWPARVLLTVVVRCLVCVVLECDHRVFLGNKSAPPPPIPPNKRTRISSLTDPCSGSTAPASFNTAGNGNMDGAVSVCGCVRQCVGVAGYWGAWLWCMCSCCGGALVVEVSAGEDTGRRCSCVRLLGVCLLVRDGVCSFGADRGSCGVTMNDSMLILLWLEGDSEFLIIYQV